MKKKVFERMKPKVQSLGFKDEELESAVERIAGNLAEDATEEQIDAAIDSVIPFLQVSQKAVTRIVNAEKAKLSSQSQPKATEGANQDPKPAGADNQETDLDKRLAALLDAKLKPVQDELNALKTEKQSQTHMSTLLDRFKAKKIDEDFYAEAMEGRAFNSDEDVEAFASRIETRWGKYSQKLADEGLDRMSIPAGGSDTKKGEISPELKQRIERNSQQAATAVPAIQGMPIQKS